MAQRLPTIHINGTTYLVDKRLLELRSINDPNRIRRFSSESKLRKFVDMVENIPTMVESGLGAFWTDVANQFPSDLPGDLSPERTITLDLAATNAVEEWILNNAS